MKLVNEDKEDDDKDDEDEDDDYDAWKILLSRLFCYQLQLGAH